MSIKITKENYGTYKQVFEIFSRRIFRDLPGGLSPETDPVSILNGWEGRNMSLARRGLQAGLNGYLSSVKDYPKEMIADINTESVRNNLPDVNALSGFIQKTLKGVLKNGKIRNLDQYYIIKEILDDTTSEITAEERDRLSDSIAGFADRSV